MIFLFPALLLLGAIVVYPILSTTARSLFGPDGSFFTPGNRPEFVGLANYVAVFTSPATLTAFKNNAIWVVVAPTLVTVLGLIFAVLTERIKWASAFKLLVFMPMAISFLAAGITFRLVYDQNPDVGVVNAAVVTVHDVFVPPSDYPGARPRDGRVLVADPDGEGFRTTASYRPGDVPALGLVGVPPDRLPDDAAQAKKPVTAADAIEGVVWVDFAPGGTGTPGVVDAAEKGMPGVVVEAVRGQEVVATTETGLDGRFSFKGLAAGDYQLRLPGSNFTPPFNGASWLGPTLITPSIIASYLWIWAGFAMVLIAAGLAALPREALEAARVDGATEWQVFRRVTIPLLAPVLIVVFVTLVINVLKVFDLVLIIAPQTSQDEATVLALEMYNASYGGGRNFGLASALAVVLFVLVLPAMLYNMRRFRRGQ
ncbi:MAG TPA: ABC transporter permease subunit [Cryptosporangiaceae bacterium]|nr:ABC transporter permease subunit [Cryptosporangiaceae bacterium]